MHFFTIVLTCLFRLIFMVENIQGQQTHEKLKEKEINNFLKRVMGLVTFTGQLSNSLADAYQKLETGQSLPPRKREKPVRYAPRIQIQIDDLKRDTQAAKDQLQFERMRALECPEINPAEVKRVKAGYKSTENSAFKFFPEPKTWFEAKMLCIVDGGHLAIINTVSEAQDFAEVLNWKVFGELDIVPAWVGFHWDDKKQIWAAICENENYNVLSQLWDTEDASENSGRECVGIKYNLVTVRLDCNLKLPYFCEL